MRLVVATAAAIGIGQSGKTKTSFRVGKYHTMSVVGPRAGEPQAAYVKGSKRQGMPQTQPTTPLRHRPVALSCPCSPMRCFVRCPRLGLYNIKGKRGHLTNHLKGEEGNVGAKGRALRRCRVLCNAPVRPKKVWDEGGGNVVLGARAALPMTPHS